MGDVVKWGLLVVGIILLISMVAELPFLEFMNLDELTFAVSSAKTISAPMDFEPKIENTEP